MSDKRNLEKHIDNKNKEIEALNFQLQKLEGFHKREIEKLEKQNDELKRQHQNWLGTQAKENEEWVKERNELKEKAH